MLEIRSDCRSICRLTTLIADINNTKYNSEAGKYNFGRGFALSYGWQLISRDTTTLFFGMGIGARGESKALRIVGSGLEDSVYGLEAGTSLSVLMQELGVLGLIVMAGFFLWCSFVLLQDVRRSSLVAISVLRVAIILFSLLWPFWLWYHRTWTFGVVMILYWAILGYLFNPNVRSELRIDHALFPERCAEPDSRLPDHESFVFD